MQKITALDIEKMVAIFIDKGMEDEVLSEMFTKSIKNKEEHIKRVSSFWKSELLNEGDYKQENFNHTHKGLDINKNVGLDQEGNHTLNNGIKVKKPLSKEHFISWINCFEKSAEAVFKEQKTVEMIVNRAKEIAKEMHEIKG